MRSLAVTLELQEGSLRAEHVVCPDPSVRMDETVVLHAQPVARPNRWGGYKTVLSAFYRGRRDSVADLDGRVDLHDTVRWLDHGRHDSVAGFLRARHVNHRETVFFAVHHGHRGWGVCFLRARPVVGQDLRGWGWGRMTVPF